MLEEPANLLLRGTPNINEIVLGHTSLEAIPGTVYQKEYIFEIIHFFQQLLVLSTISNQPEPTAVLQVADFKRNHYFGNKEICEKKKQIFRLSWIRTRLL